ncbi:unnamed protein product [Cochlearia groenlandica]
MESRKLFGSEEDCRSCESGWTMYLASPSHDYHHHHDDGCNYYDDDDDEDSYGGDSMDSDASSGPMEITSCLKNSQEIDEQNSLENKKTKNQDMVLMETTRAQDSYVVDDNDDDDDDDDGDKSYYDDGNDSYSVVHSYVGAVN